MNEDVFRPFTLEVKTLAEACVLKAKLNCGFDDASGADLGAALDDSEARNLLEQADIDLYQRIDELFECNPDWAAEALMREPQLDSDGEFRFADRDGDCLWFRKEDLPQLRRAVAAFEAAS